jgi:hypothetical protein
VLLKSRAVDRDHGPRGRLGDDPVDDRLEVRFGVDADVLDVRLDLADPLTGEQRFERR